MTKQEQIEEMAKTACDACAPHACCPLTADFRPCEPSYNIDAMFIVQTIQRINKKINDLPPFSKERSEISPQYAEQFIKEFIL